MRPTSNVQRPTFLIALSLCLLVSLSSFTGCATEALKQTAQGTDDRAGVLEKRVAPENRELASQVKLGTSATRKFIGEPKNPVRTDEEFKQAAAKTMKQAEKKTNILAWVIGAGSLLSTVLGIATGMGFIKNARLRQGIELVTGTIEKASKTSFSQPDQVIKLIKNTIAGARNPEINRIVQTKIDPKT